MKAKLEGRNVVLEALSRGRRVFEIKIDKGAKGDKIDEILQKAKASKVGVTLVDRRRLDAITSTDAHQGVIAMAEALHTEKLSAVLERTPSPFMVVLREVYDKGNLGAIMRSGAAAGLDALIVSPTKKGPFSAQAERVSMGASNAVPVISLGVFDAISLLSKAGVKIVGVEVSGNLDYFATDLTGSVAFIFGGEDRGLSLPIREKCDIVVRVPMKGGVQSLNLSATAAVLMFEKVRQAAVLPARKN